MDWTKVPLISINDLFQQSLDKSKLVRLEGKITSHTNIVKIGGGLYTSCFLESYLFCTINVIFSNKSLLVINMLYDGKERASKDGSETIIGGIYRPEDDDVLIHHIALPPTHHGCRIVDWNSPELDSFLENEEWSHKNSQDTPC